jgi:excisionase family DNA binding protein
MSIPNDPISQTVAAAVRSVIEELALTLRNRLMTVERAAEYLGIEPDSIRRMVALRKLRKVSIFERKHMFDIRENGLRIWHDLSAPSAVTQIRPMVVT